MIKMHALVIAMFFGVGALQAQEPTVRKQGKKFVFVDLYGQPYFAESWEGAKDFAGGLAAVQVNGKWGYIDLAGYWVRPAEFDAASSFTHPLAIVEKEGQFALLDKNGLLQTAFVPELRPAGDYYIIREDEVYGLLDAEGHILVEPQYQKVDGFYGGQLGVKRNDQWGTWRDGKEDFTKPYTLFLYPEEAPIYSQKCLNEMDPEKRKDCDIQAMLTHIYRNIKYPAEARENGIEGTVLTEFVVNADGQVSEYYLVSEPGGRTGEAAMKVVRMIQRFARPAQQDGKPVRMLYRLPIRFKLQ